MIGGVWVAAFFITAPIVAGIAAGIALDAFLSLRELRRGELHA